MLGRVFEASKERIQIRFGSQIRLTLVFILVWSTFCFHLGMDRNRKKLVLTMYTIPQYPKKRLANSVKPSSVVLCYCFLLKYKIKKDLAPQVDCKLTCLFSLGVFPRPIRCEGQVKGGQANFCQFANVFFLSGSCLLSVSSFVASEKTGDARRDAN